jgi:hypothetical protein
MLKANLIFIDVLLMWPGLKPSAAQSSHHAPAAASQGDRQVNSLFLTDNSLDARAPMTWTTATGNSWSVARDAYEPFVALVHDAGIKLLYIGESSHFGPNEIFE